MILECPNCEIRYEIPIELPPEGRKVRCAACRHVWTATTVEEPKPEVSLPNFEDEEIIFREEAETATEAPDSLPESDTAPETEAGPADSTAEPETAPEAEAASDDQSLSESAMEEAFSAAVEEAAAADADLAESEESEDEAESPPIVIGKAKKRRRPIIAQVAAGWAGLALVLAGIASLAYFQRVNIVRMLPGAASAYERAGLPVNVRGLEFDKVKYSWETSTGRPVLEVYGDIVNITSKPLKVPTVVFGLRTKEKVEVYQWAMDVRSELLPAGERTAFSAQIPAPPKSIRDVKVRFAKIR